MAGSSWPLGAGIPNVGADCETGADFGHADPCIDSDGKAGPRIELGGEFGDEEGSPCDVSGC